MTASATLPPGRALDVGTRRRMEHGFGADLSAVRVHEGPEAAAAADALGAKAFAYGDHVVLGRSYAGAGDAARRVLAHELAHVIQQRAGAGAAPVASQEADAGAAASRVLGGAPARVAVATAPQVALAPKEPDDDRAEDRRRERERDEARREGARRKQRERESTPFLPEEAPQASRMAIRDLEKKIAEEQRRVQRTGKPTRAQTERIQRLHEEIAGLQRAERQAWEISEAEAVKDVPDLKRTPQERKEDAKRRQRASFNLSKAKGKAHEELAQAGRKGVRTQVPFVEGQEVSREVAAARIAQNQRIRAENKQRKKAGQKPLPTLGLRITDEVVTRRKPDGTRQKVLVERKNNALDAMDAKQQQRAVRDVIKQLRNADRHEPPAVSRAVKFSKRPATSERQADHERKLAARILTQNKRTDEVWFGDHRIDRESAKKEIAAEVAVKAEKERRKREIAEEKKAKAVRAKAQAGKKPRAQKPKAPASKAATAKANAGTKGQTPRSRSKPPAVPPAPAAAVAPVPTPEEAPSPAKKTSTTAKRRGGAKRPAPQAPKAAAPNEQLATTSKVKTTADKSRTARQRQSTPTEAPRPAKVPVAPAPAEHQPAAKLPTPAKTPAPTPRLELHEEAGRTAKPPPASRRAGAQPDQPPARKPAVATKPAAVSPTTTEPRTSGKSAGNRRAQIGAKVTAAAGAAEKVLDVVDAVKQYGRLRDQGASVTDALGTVAFSQTQAGQVIYTYENAVAGGQSKGEAVATTVGTQLGRFAPGGGATSAVIGVVNHAAHTLGAPQGVTDTTTLISEATPGSMGSQLLTAGARSWYNLADAAVTGDTKGLDRMVGDMKKGGLGTPLQGYAMMAEGIADIAAGDDAEQVLERLAKAGKGSVADRVGSYLGDKMWDLHEWVTGNSDEDWKKQVEEINRRVEARRRERQLAAQPAGGVP